ncbi:MAG: FAD-dependent oxidoreductase [Fuerstiella sp.]
MQYDLTILGNDEAAFETALAANAHGLKTLVVVSDRAVSSWQKTRALQHLAQERFSNYHGRARSTGLSDLALQFPTYLQMELQEFNTSLRTAGIDVLNALAEFESTGSLRLSFPDFSRPVTIASENIVVATGVQRTTFPFCDRNSQADATDTVFGLSELPRHARIIGGGDFGAALAACLRTSGVATQLISRASHDSSALELANSSGVQIADHPEDLPTYGVNGETFFSIDCRGRRGLTRGLNLEKINVEADEHGQLWCGRHFETWCRGVYGVGDVVGFSSDSTHLVATQAKIVVNRIRNAQPQTPKSTIALTAAM